MKRVLLFLIVLQLSSSQRCPVCKDYYCLENIWKDCPQTLVNSNITNISNASINCISVQYIAQQEYRQLKDCVIGTEAENCQLFYQEYGIQNVNCTVVPAFVDIQPSSNQLERNRLANGTSTGQGLNLNLNCSSPCLNLNLSLFLSDDSNSTSSISSSESLSYSYDETLNVSYLNFNFSSNSFGNLSFNLTEDSSDSDLNYSYDLIFATNSSVNLNESDLLLSNLNPIPIPIYSTSLNQSLNLTSSEEDSGSDLSYSYDWNSNSSFNLTSNETDFLSSDPVIISSNPVLGYSGNSTSNSSVSFTSAEDNSNSELNSSANLNLILNKNYSMSSDIILNTTSYENLSFSSTEQESNSSFNPILQTNSNLNVDFNVSQASIENNNSYADHNFTDSELSSSLEFFINSSQNLPLASNSEIDLSLNSSLQNLEQANTTERILQTNNSDFDKMVTFSPNSTEQTLTPTEPTISLLSFFNTTPNLLSDATVLSESPILSTTSDYELSAETNSLTLTDLSSVSSTLPSDSSLGPYQDFSPTSNILIFDGVEPNSNESENFTSFSSNTDSAISSPLSDSTSESPSFALSSGLANSTTSNFDVSPTLALNPNFSYSPNQGSTVTPTSYNENYSLSITYTSPTSNFSDLETISPFDNYSFTSSPGLNLSSADSLDVTSSSSNPTESFKISLTTSPTSNTNSFDSSTTTEPVLRPGFATRPGFLTQNSGLTTPTSRSNSSFRIDPNISFPSSDNSTRSNFTSNTTPSFYTILRDMFRFNVSTTPSFRKKLNVTSRPHPTSPSYTSSFTFNWIPDRHVLPFIPTPSVNGNKPKKPASQVSPDLKPSPDSASINTVNVIIEILVLMLSVFELC
ncbi:dentin sialophosphoprotein isoform X1 [Tribolium castaneum]|uniref:dentin sialophosphoprotein isoform X1 n=2 Tax=Tribolium castaneum TaxID=7070 RepID=UPI00077DDCFD|nr:PREDICTED: dentin sialophosphoprotein isoform X1 [Tribolium castaneum]|eukprot:XP_015838267.1 PREDICTED: dentin sialophosphoprotein isoform X1 [Tribolium castaneum]